MIERLVMVSWYGRLQWTWIFLPLMWIFSYVVKRKRARFLSAGKIQTPVPVVVVGNITVGGTGKTPLVQTLVSALLDQGYRPGIISRGFGAQMQQFPHLIVASDSSALVGDEPFMLYRSLHVPVVIDPHRKRALDKIVQLGVDIVISDDGMQHYKLPRDMEICVLDGARGVGNGCLLPVGPLREPLSRLKDADFVLHSGLKGKVDQFDFLPLSWVNVKTGIKIPLHEFKPEKGVSAIAGIGNPKKFTTTLLKLNIECPLKAFPDHHAYCADDFIGMDGQILMTEKDAVKITDFARENMWFLQIRAQLDESFIEQFMFKVKHFSELENG